MNDHASSMFIEDLINPFDVRRICSAKPTMANHMIDRIRRYIV